MLWLDDFPIEVFRLHRPEQNVDSVVRKVSTELDLVISKPAMFASEGSDNKFPEKWDFGHQDDGLPIFKAVDADALNNGGLTVSFNVKE